MSEKKPLFDRKNNTDDEYELSDFDFNIPSNTNIDDVLDGNKVSTNLSKTINQKQLNNYLKTIDDLRNIFYNAKNLTNNYKKIDVYSYTTNHVNNYNQKIESSNINQTANELIYYAILNQKLEAEKMLKHLDSTFK